jgi:hypothetical protein
MINNNDAHRVYTDAITAHWASGPPILADGRRISRHRFIRLHDHRHRGHLSGKRDPRLDRGVVDEPCGAR